MDTDTSTANKWRSERKIFSAFITKKAVPITDIEVVTSIVNIRSRPYFLLLVPILPSISAAFFFRARPLRGKRGYGTAQSLAVQRRSERRTLAKQGVPLCKKKLITSHFIAFCSLESIALQLF